MGGQYSSVRTASFAATNCRIIANEAREALKRLDAPGKSRPRSQVELNAFLKAVGELLEPLVAPIPFSSITDGVEPSGLLLQPMEGSDSPRGPAWAVAVALVNEIGAFKSFVNEHGQIATYLAALALSDADRDDHSMIVGLNLAVANLRNQQASGVNTEIAKNPRSPFRALVLSVLDKNQNDTVEEIWVKLQGLSGKELEIKFNGKDVTFDDPDFFIIGNTEKERRMKSYVEWDIGTGKPTRFNRSSLDKMISELRIEHGLFKCI